MNPQISFNLLISAAFLMANLVFLASALPKLSFCEITVNVSSLTNLTKNPTVLSPGENALLSCPDGLKFQAFNNDKIQVECVSGNIVKTQNGYFKLDDLICTKTGESVEKVGYCHTGNERYKLVEIGFQDRGYNLITICHDEVFDMTLWTSHIIQPGLREILPNPPSFRKNQFYNDIDPDYSYTQVVQAETILALTGRDDYSMPGTSDVLERGHLSPKADFTFAYEQDATYYFINVCPQWRRINNGNWGLLEDKVRVLVDREKSDFSITTGTYGTLALANSDSPSKQIDIWIGRSSKNNDLYKNLPVNKYLWKVIHDQKRKLAVAVIIINNPYVTRQSAAASNIFCPGNNVCDQLPWVTWNVTNTVSGYTFCCDVATFGQAVSYAPKLGNLGLLV